ncbi:uncharacterized protein LOC116415749 [Nasonia vitripennis]|uniref:Uncharacterized protein n=1 Tax=Nasonia vitripennis TaxID=7425 RepID=A0A7M7PWH9_NASVI|nr:uncharacterized protein LOC116415749 [Nasonia vitripennis]
MGKKGGLVSTSGFQFNYNLPSNATELEPMLLHARNKRQVEQQQQQQQQQQSPLELKNIYASLEELLERQGWNDGQQCLLRTICELSETPLGRSNEDVVEEMLHLLLTPSEDNPREEEEEEDVYRRAELVGKEERNCRKAYRGCLESPLESFTEIYDDRDRRKASARTEMKELDATLQLYSRSDY